MKWDVYIYRSYLSTNNCVFPTPVLFHTCTIKLSFRCAIDHVWHRPCDIEAAPWGGHIGTDVDQCGGPLRHGARVRPTCTRATTCMRATCMRATCMRATCMRCSVVREVHVLRLVGIFIAPSSMLNRRLTSVSPPPLLFSPLLSPPPPPPPGITVRIPCTVSSTTRG